MQHISSIPHLSTIAHKIIEVLCASRAHRFMERILKRRRYEQLSLGQLKLIITASEPCLR